MVVKPFDNRVLDELCSKDQLDLLDSVDRLRSQGIDHYVSLPQIIVCGDQSSGKSSVLEAISGVSFPVKSNLCTRFPTELVLRKTPHIGVTVSIVPDHSHNEAERTSLSNFQETLDSFQELPDLIENAKKAMAIGSFGRAFSKDLLRIEISGPDRPHLTIVDLPGLIHSETKQQSAADIELVQDVVKSYMTEPRSIILAVVSAKNDYANQIVLKLARAADVNGTRTLGVITKPDTLMPGSDSEMMYVSLAQNLDVEFRLGWHVLKNMDSETGAWAPTKRDSEERRFFAEGIWRTLPESILGIVTLRERLSKLLLAQIAAELPSLIEEIEIKSTTCRTQLQKLGLPRASVEEQRLYLLTLSQAFQSLTKAAVDGTYNSDFFGDAKTDIGYEKRIRAVIQNLNESFAKTMTREGHYYVITDPCDDDPIEIGSTKVKVVTRKQFLARIESLMKRTRGCELPGTFNPMIISDLFLDQSRPWQVLATQHMEQVAQAVTQFLQHLVSHIADASTGGALFQTLVEPALENIIKDAKRKTADLLAPHQQGHPITYNHYFTETVQQVKKDRSRAELTRIIKNVFGVTSLGPSSSAEYVNMNFHPLLDALMKYNNPDMNLYACSEALDCMQAYYKVAFKRFVDDIAVQAVETSLIARLGDILSPIRVTYLAAAEVTSVAGESDESRAKRKRLNHQLEVLSQGLETCKKFAMGTVQGTRDVVVLPTRSPYPNLSPLSSEIESNEIASNGEVEDVETEPAAPCEEPPHPLLEPELAQTPTGPDFTIEVVPEPVVDEWDFGTVAKSSKKKKKSRNTQWPEN
ncbi:hypothetical protein OPT61_g1076 [Boeremia exigua]|uniref:Uncharacterized protein n=1 Tax=Boeremia exigua TaxID=749465 RepID=A0ACC2IRQ3_9PLEO|nr:hypothetical protein OPT61_g1076 [Boeremia exigua]